MKLLFYQWEGFMQRDVESALHGMGVDYDVFRFPFKQKNDADKLRRELSALLREKGDIYDGIISLNYRDEVAICANIAGIEYIAWIYDSPFGISQSEETLKLNTNHIFIFDGRDYHNLKNRGVDTVYHMDLAVNTARIDTLKLTDSDIKKYGADIAFVGSLYPSSYVGFRSKISEDEARFVEDIITKQQGVQGKYLLDELTYDDVWLERLQTTLEGEYQGYDRLFHEGLQSIIAKETTRRDRLMLLLYFSEIFGRVVLYTDRSDALLTKVINRGVVESYEEIFKVYKASKINLNITYRRIASGIPLRALEILGSGGFLMSNWQQELVDKFEPDVDCVVYESLEDAANKAEYYLKNDDKRLKIAEHGRESAKKYSYENQLSNMFDIVFGESRGGVV